jgi:nucleoside-diphosphate-sugar epimerase
MEIAKIVRKVYQIRYIQKIPIITPNKVILEDEAISASERYQISNSKIREIGFVPRYDLQIGINELFNYLEKYHDII